MPGARAFSSASTRSIGGLVLPIAPRALFSAFLGTENPVSGGGAEGSLWINGGTTGVRWLDVRCTPGLAFASGVSPSPPYNDPSAVFAGIWGPLQTVEAVVKVPASSAQNQEVELRLLTQITPNRIVGYEVLFSVTSNPYVDIERWDGGTSLTDFFSVTGGSVLAPQPLATGHRVKARISAAGLIEAFCDYGAGYVLVASGTDTKYRSGSPGIGFFQNGGSTATLSDFGISAVSAWAL